MCFRNILLIQKDSDFNKYQHKEILVNFEDSVFGLFSSYIFTLSKKLVEEIFFSAFETVAHSRTNVKQTEVNQDYSSLERMSVSA